MSSEWHDGLDDEQITQLKVNLTPNCYLPEWKHVAFAAMPNTDRVRLRDEGLWVRDDVVPYQRISNAVCRLSANWTRPEDTPWIDVKPYPANGQWKCPHLDSTWAYMDTLPRFLVWLLTRYEWIDDSGQRFQWDERRGCDWCRVPAKEQVAGIQYRYPGKLRMSNSTTPSVPILVRLLKEVPK